VILKQASYGGKGIYYLDGGGFKSTGATVTMDTTTTGGVMLYNAPRSASMSEKIQITGNSAGKFELGPLTDGAYAGMLLRQDRTSTVDLLVEGNGELTMRRTSYAAKAKLNINGNGDPLSGFYLDGQGKKIFGASRIGSQFIAGNLSVGGNGNIVIIYNGPDVARTRVIALVE
jgi:hypothetical protein